MSEWPHTISVPRLRPAPGAHIEEVQYPISDEEFKKLVAVIRISVPYTGLILSTRESQKLREELLDLGISQLSAGSSTSPGGYRELKNTVADQFYTNDNRSLDQVSASIIDLGYVPSFCTACYRVGRTGEHFMRLVKEGKMKNICRYNALLTLKEYGETFASDATKGAAEDLIAGLIDEIDDPRLKEQVKAKLKRIENGERDLFI
jgi:2-iminoacetate synthase